MKQLRFSSISILFFILVCRTNGFAQSAPRRVIIDTDPGTDDAMAIILALNSPELKVEALTVVPGNVDAQQGLENALKIVSLAGRCDVTVAGGSTTSAESEVDYRTVLAWKEWSGQRRVATYEMQGGSKVWSGSHHRNGPQIPTRDHANSGWAADQYCTCGFERSFDRDARQGYCDHGRVDHRWERQRSGGSEYLQRSGSCADCVQCGMDGNDGRV
jgi:uncharacterized membrane protein